ncbi:MAG: hypothetical protein JNN15_20140 [Blastocatellia bacterium]|nr:hypothetical protein [Blastocatellia bacterium]
MSTDNFSDLKEASQLLDYAHYYLGQGEFNLAMQAAKEARDLYEDMQLAGGNAEARWVIAYIHFLQGDFKEALPLLASAQQQFAAIGFVLQQSATLFLLAQCHYALEKRSKAVYTLKLAHSILETKQQQLAPESERSNFYLDKESLIKMIEETLVEIDV